MTHPTDISEALARVIRDKRAERGLSQRDLAEATGIALVTISRKERGFNPFNAIEIAAIATALGTSFTDLSLAAERVASTAAA